MHMPRVDTSISEQELFDAVASGDGEAFGLLIERHEGWLRGVVYSVLGRTDELEDVIQQVWGGLWRRREALGDVRNWRNWLYCTTRRAAIDAGRRRQRRGRLHRALFARLGPGVAETHRPDRSALLRDEYRRAVRAVGGLPARYRTPLVLRVWSDMSYREIAETLDMPEATVATNLARARKMLRRKLSQVNDDGRESD